LIVGVRRDEEGSRSKERVFSERTRDDSWDYTNQPPELWDQFKTDFPKGNHIRVHPILAWSEVDIWEYIRREQIPIIDLYFAKNGKRYRSLGCACCTGMIDSEADTLDKIIEELKHTKTGERAGRKQDQEDAYAMQKLRKGSITRIKRAMKRFEREIAAGSADRNRIRAVLVSWLGHAEHANVPRLREKIILWSRENMGIELSKGGDTDV
jgi:hypothetical protein